MPDTIPNIPRISIDELKQRFDHGDVFILDVRGQPDDMHIAGDVRYDPSELLAADRIQLPVPSNALIVPYCT